MSASPITTHILDTTQGRPASGIAVFLFTLKDNQWLEIGSGTTNKDGRVTDLLPRTNSCSPGIYKIRFNTGHYFKTYRLQGFYPYVDIVFEITNAQEHYHVPLLLSPFGYSTYRGS